MENSKIEWTDHTYNPWIGCTKVSPGCAHCYAAVSTRARVLRAAGQETWGKGAERSRTQTSGDPLRWNAEAATAKVIDGTAWLAGGTCEVVGKPGTFRQSARPALMPAKQGRLHERDFTREEWDAGLPWRPRVFCASLSDWLDDEVPIEWLADLLDLIRRTPNLDWLLLTKRPENWRKRLCHVIAYAGGDDSETGVSDKTYGFVRQWITGDETPLNVWVGTTVEDQQRADERIPQLMRIPAKVRFLSCEPLLGPVRLRSYCPDQHVLLLDSLSPTCGSCHCPTLLPDWVICGGESGPDARPMRPNWARNLRDQCSAAGVPFLFKQWGDHAPCPPPVVRNIDGGLVATSTFKSQAIYTEDPSNGEWLERVGKKAAGRLLDGRTWDALPKP